jgi:hypothetical protein
VWRIRIRLVSKYFSLSGFGEKLMDSFSTIPAEFPLV